MSYIVVYQRTDGSSGLEECANLDLAVVAAERLRNVDSVENSRIFKTEEVKFDFRPYYRVEVSDGAEGLTSSNTTDPVTTAPDPVTAASSIVAPVVESDPPPPTAPVSERPSSTTSIDPWAAVDLSSASPPPPPAAVDTASTETESTETEPIDYSNVSTDTESDAVAATDGDAEDVPDADASRGLFSTASLPEPPPDGSDIGKLAEDVSDAVPPRRGLFGR